MTDLQFPRHGKSDSLAFLRGAGADTPPSSAQVKCPNCLIETVLTPATSMDTQVACDSCGVAYEFRQGHEAWCASRRRRLARACPELAWPVDDQWAGRSFAIRGA